MSAPEIRGSWTVTEGMITRLIGSGLDAWLKSQGSEWSKLSAAQQAKLLAVIDGDARPKTPHPYVTFEQGDAIPVESDSGTTSDQHTRRERIPFTFRAFGSTKEQARDAIRTVKNALEGKPATCLPDKWVQTISGADFPMREGDTEWSWTWLMQYEIDATFLTNR